MNLLLWNADIRANRRKAQAKVCTDTASFAARYLPILHAVNTISMFFIPKIL